MRPIKTTMLTSMVNSTFVDAPMPSNISYMWNFGSLLGATLVLQIITGVTLAMHYCPNTDLAFSSVEHIMRDVNSGYLIRYAHANGASMFFILVYLHIARGLYYGSYTKPRVLLWSIGVIILVLLIIIAFLGYVLPWGQMSYWGATVITNLLSAIPVVGGDLVQLAWGGFCVDNATLNRFFSLHYLLPFALSALVIIHIVALHAHGSNNPLGITSNADKVTFHPYFTFKDLVGFIVWMIVLAFLVFYAPNMLGHPDNYIQANPLSTPLSIVPEWYLLPFYAILRAIPNKLGGVAAMGGALLILLILPFVHTSKVKSNTFRPLAKFAFWLFAADFFLLMVLGGLPIEEPYTTISVFAVIFYFSYFLILVPLIGILENILFNLGRN